MRTKNLVLTGLFIAISFIGANIKIAGSIAFDSMAGFLAALILGPGYGAIVGALGHLLTAVTSGFPLSLPVHMVVMLDMALTMFLFGISYKLLSKVNNKTAIILSSIIGVLINGPVSTFMIIPITGSGVLAMLPMLTLAALLNIILTYVIYIFLPKSITGE